VVQALCDVAHLADDEAGGPAPGAGTARAPITVSVDHLFA
jgi:hypothetical protein